jgi:hypothetical protein
LPWDRLYLLVTPPARPGPGAAPPHDPIDPLALARDDVAQDALAWDRPVLAPLLPGDCPQLAGPVAESEVASVDWEPAAGSGDGDAVIFRDDDATAARIAARIAALQGRSRVRGLRSGHFAYALREQQGRAFLVPVDRSLPTACLQLAGLLGRAAWLQAAVASEPAPGAPGEALVPGNDLVARRLVERGLVVPLVAVRNHVAARHDVRGLRVAWDGTPLVAGLGRVADPGPAPDRRELP